MSAGHSLRPKQGFDWLAVSWGGPDQQRTDKCSYCEAPLKPDDVPLILWNEQGWCAEFCEACVQRWWGFRSVTDAK
jgi:hypothetical protein